MNRPDFTLNLHGDIASIEAHTGGLHIRMCGHGAVMLFLLDTALSVKLADAMNAVIEAHPLRGRYSATPGLDKIEHGTPVPMRRAG